MKRRFRLLVTGLCILIVALGTIPDMLSAQAANSGELEWPNPGAVKLTKAANPVEGKPDEWDITLTVEGKNLKSDSSDIVLVIDKSGSMSRSPNQNRLPKAKDAAKKFIDNLLIEGSEIRIAVVSFNTTSEQVSDFKGLDQKTQLKRAIDNIQAQVVEGTNIQAGLHEAQELLKTSSANNRVIVLLSDGEPTYSYKAGKAVPGSWNYNSHNFMLSDFDYGADEIIGSCKYSLRYGRSNSGSDSGYTFCNSYFVNGYEVLDNGIGTISEAKLAGDAGIGIYSIGLDVGNNSIATDTLKEIANKGYYSGSSDSLERIFSELTSKIVFAVENAAVTDPMGDMFDLKLKGSFFGPDDYKASQGEVTLDPQTETLNWNIGNVMEGEPATITYRVKLDHSKNLEPNRLYPTNKTTTMVYTDAKGERTSKDFEVPQVSMGKGSILVKAYKVNAKGKPINSDGQEVERPDLAQELYSRYHEENGSEALEVGKSYSVPAPVVPGYTLKVGGNPTNVNVTLNEPSLFTWLGYSDIPNKLTIVHRSGDRVLERSDAEETPGESIDVSTKNFTEYEFSSIEVSEGSGLSVDNGHVNGIMPGKDVTIAFNYTAQDQGVELRYVDRATGKDFVNGNIVVDSGIGTNIEGDDVVDSGIGTNIEGDDVVDSGIGMNIEGDDVVDSGIGMNIEGDDVVDSGIGMNIEGDDVVDSGIGMNIEGDDVVDNGIGTDSEAKLACDAGYSIGLDGGNNSNATNTLKDEANKGYYSGNSDSLERIFPELTISQYVESSQMLTVKYLEQGTEKKLAAEKKFGGVTGQTIELTAEEVAGYTPMKPSDMYKFIEKEGQDYIFYYTKNSSNPGSGDSSGGSRSSTITPSPKPLLPLPPVPPKLDMENHSNYINGYPDGTVKPENQIAREEIAAIFYRLMENESFTNYMTGQNSFSDVVKKRWSNKYISTMERVGIITGYQDGTFKPGQSITRAEFAAIASRFDKLNNQANDMFADISGHWAEKYIVSAANKGWIKGYPDDTFKPNQYITRAEAMAFINSVLNRKVKAADIHADAKQWPDNKPGKWYYSDVLEATNHHEYSRSEDGYESWDSIQPDQVYP
ncbi:S-layer homology domain-containing protein [Paenibacillus popilliae]|uniref:VWA domain-containing protein n=1 Tax=Paenibacillus popilliae ATCC 14706 TaxID=1212764 RepID=M9M401_PAEPP|nr:S-layer homology domain-containing protein [Paenibacillus popilliae]GAC42003.1 hypothetical protein PPOP_1360 [Paenibacillus popilliae ATCC 14706]